MEERNSHDQYYLSTEGYYFKYRHDKYDKDVWRVTLYNEEGGTVDDVRVSAHELGTPERDHHWVINYFEARLTLKLIR